MKTLLWLDDVRDPFQNDWINFSPIGKNVGVVWVTTYQEFVDWIMIHGLPDAICFDHDLNDGEVWKTYDLDNRFLLSNFGNIMKNNTKYNPFKNIGGLTFQVKINNFYKNKSVHREIAKIFIENPENKPQVNHIDGNRFNNHIKNLEWCTNSENVKHSHDKLKRTFSAYGENHANSKTVSQYSKDNILINIYGSVNEAGRQLGIQFTNIAKCARGERKTAGGFVWKYENLKHTIHSEIEHRPQTRYEIMDTYFIPNYVEKTGYDCAKWLVEYCIDNNKSLPKYAIQSANPVGKENINSLLMNFNKFNKNV